MWFRETTPVEDPDSPELQASVDAVLTVLDFAPFKSHSPPRLARHSS
jgi:hypothetical protein